MHIHTQHTHNTHTHHKKQGLTRKKQHIKNGHSWRQRKAQKNKRCTASMRNLILPEVHLTEKKKGNKMEGKKILGTKLALHCVCAQRDTPRCPPYKKKIKEKKASEKNDRHKMSAALHLCAT